MHSAPALAVFQRVARRLRAARSGRATPCAAADAPTLDACAKRRRLRRGPCRGPIRRLLLASLAGRVAFSMLPLGFVLFAVAETGSTATSGAMVAAFVLASSLAPARGRIVDRYGPRALAAFALACAAGIAALVLAAPPARRAACSSPCARWPGSSLPPLGPFTRAVWGLALRDRSERLAAHLRARLGGRGGGADRLAAARRGRRRAGLARRRAARGRGRAAGGDDRRRAQPAERADLAPGRAGSPARASRGCPRRSGWCSPRWCRPRRRSARSTSPSRPRRARRAPGDRGPALARWRWERWPAACWPGAGWRWPAGFARDRASVVMGAGLAAAAAVARASRSSARRWSFRGGARGLFATALPARRPPGARRIGYAHVCVAGHGEQRRPRDRRGDRGSVQRRPGAAATGLWFAAACATLPAQYRRRQPPSCPHANTTPPRLPGSVEYLPADGVSPASGERETQEGP